MTTVGGLNEEIFRDVIDVVVTLSDDVAVATRGSTLSSSHDFSVFSSKLEVTAFRCSSSYQRELQFIFPGIDLTNAVAITTFQQTVVDLVVSGGDQDVEKDRCLEAFFAFAKQVCDELRSHGHFADYIDPCSGLAMITKDANKVFSEVDSAQQLLGYSVMNAGCCKVLLHPSWGSAVYPATIFTNATTEEVVDALGVEA